MKHLQLFETKSLHDTIYNGNGYEEPWVAYIENDELVTYNKVIDYKNIVGSIIYAKSNGKLKATSKDEWNSSLGTPVAVVVIPASHMPDGKCRGMSLCNMSYKTPQTGTLGTVNGNASNNGTNLMWGVGGTDVDGLTNYTSEDDAKTDMDGKSNTSVLVNLSAIKDKYTSGAFENAQANYPAAFACHLFSTLGTSQGDWYLPAIGELYSGLCTNKSIVSASLATLGDKAVGLVDGGSSLGYCCWSSSEYNTDTAWRLLNNGNVGISYKGSSGDNIRVRAFAAFDI